MSTTTAGIIFLALLILALVAVHVTVAGAAAAAGLAHGLALGRPWDERLRHAVALGTASAMALVAGEFSPADYARLLDATVVTRSTAGARGEAV